MKKNTIRTHLMKGCLFFFLSIDPNQIKNASTFFLLELELARARHF